VLPSYSGATICSSAASEVDVVTSGDYNNVSFWGIAGMESEITLEETEGKIIITNASGNEIAKDKIGYSISFNSLGGTPLKSIANITPQTIVTAPENPELEGYVFDGWYTEPEYTNQWSFSNPITKDLILYAKWSNNGDNDNDEIPLQSISLNKSSIIMNKGNKELLKIECHPSTTTADKSISWETSNPNAAIVDSNGLVTAIGPGNAKITAQVIDNPFLYAECVISVPAENSSQNWFMLFMKRVLDWFVSIWQSIFGR
jgi:uncharacterized repeat protein (TIGR02543 family)